MEKKKGANPRGKGSRELKNLISHIHYDNGSAKKQKVIIGKGGWFVIHAAEKCEGHE